MSVAKIIEALGYRDSKNYLQVDKGIDTIEYAHLFRRAKESSGLHGVYLLREESQTTKDSTPVVYVAKADTVAEADQIHKRVWNQNVVPFLIVALEGYARLYAGFRYQPDEKENNPRGVLESNVPDDQISNRLAAFRAQSIDQGTIWREQNHNVTPETRVDWKLLKNLTDLAGSLKKGSRNQETPYALIGKFIYLRYLRDRKILSDTKLAEFGVNHDEIFGRDAKLKKVQKVIANVDDWLNGSIFDLDFSGPNAPTDANLQEVTAAFLGDDVESGQQHLPFQAYDFSHLSIETLSNIYEKFLALKEQQDPQGAFYTPLPLVNFMLTEMDNIRPFRETMRVLDPSCGSGAFLVQCYRRLVERYIVERGDVIPKPSELRSLLLKHIFGVERDKDACEVTKLSLLLTLLDYVKQPDLQNTNFQLPTLDENIFAGDFFDTKSEKHQVMAKRSYDWIVGNPPWIKLSKAGKHAQTWVEKHEKLYPIAQARVEEAFAWKASTHLAEDGIAGILLPAMSLVEEDGDAFRKPFFKAVNLVSVANFANLRRVLFDSAKQPAAALFFSSLLNKTKLPESNVLSYAPMVANQTANRPQQKGEQKKIWTITLQYSEVKALRRKELQEGSGLPWKLAMWGSHRDEQLLRKLEKQFSSLEQFGEVERGWEIVSGLQLRKKDDGKTEPVSNLAGKPLLDVNKLRRVGRLHDFSSKATHLIPASNANVRKRGGFKPLGGCEGPHVIVSAARIFAVFVEHFLVVPHPHIGIAGAKESSSLLKATSIFLSSKFAKYHQFISSPQEGIHGGRATLQALRALPIPLGRLDDNGIKEWVDLHKQLAQTTQKKWNDDGLLVPSNHLEIVEKEIETLEIQLNQKVYNLLGLSPQERNLIEDLVNVKMDLVDGKFGDKATNPPLPNDRDKYEKMLEAELNSFLGKDSSHCYRVSTVEDKLSGLVIIERLERQKPSPEEDRAKLLERRDKIAQRQSQWIYFERNFFDYDERYLYFLKPMQKLWWTQSQALLDADQIRAVRPDLFPQTEAQTIGISLFLRPTPHQRDLFLKKFGETLKDEDEVLISKSYVRAETVSDSHHRKIKGFEDLSGDAILFFIDHRPQANLGHPCTYVLFMLREGKFHQAAHNMLPAIEIELVEFHP
jgi:hypothetical protein